LDALILSGDFSMDGNPADARQLMQEIDLFFPDLPVAFVPRPALHALRCLSG
jgi:hypothetical protein